MRKRIWWLVGVAAMIGLLFEGAFAASNPASIVNKKADTPKTIYTIQVMSVVPKDIDKLDHQAEQLFHAYRLICFIGKKGDTYTLSVGGFKSKDKAEDMRGVLLKDGLIKKDSFVRPRGVEEVPYLAMSGKSKGKKKDIASVKDKVKPSSKENLNHSTPNSENKIKYSETKTTETEKSQVASNSLLNISIKNNRVILKGKNFWGKTLLNYLDDPPRYVLRLFNTENQSMVDTLYSPQRDIEKLMVRYDKDSKTTSVILTLKGEQECNLEKHGEELDMVLKNSEVTAVSSAKVILGGTSASPFGERRVYKGRRVSLEFKDADVRDVIGLMAQISGLNFVIDPTVHGSVTLRLKNVPWDQALDLILRMNKLGMLEENGVVRISTLSDITAEMHAQESATKAIENVAPIVTDVIPLNYSKAADVEDLVDSLLSDRGEVDVVERTNSLIVKDTQDRIDAILDFIDQLDTPTPQVQIAAKIVVAATEYTKELGIQWGFLWHQSATEMNFPYSFDTGGGTPIPANPGGFIPGYVVDLPAAAGTGAGGAIAATLLNKNKTFGVNMRLSALQDNGEAKIISQPKVITLDNQEAKIEQGTQIPYQTVSESGTETQFEDATLSLTVTPHITSNGDVMMDVEVTKDEPDWTHVTKDGVPIATRSINTSVRMRNGDTLVIGGIYEENSGYTKNGIPGLSRLPLFSWLFTHELDKLNKNELLIFITPTIINIPRKPRKAVSKL